MSAIFKYMIPIKERHEIVLPLGSEIIRVEGVEGLFFLWAIVNTDKEHPKERRSLAFYKTGQEMEEPTSRFKYLGNCKIFVGQELCLYVFEDLIKTKELNNPEV